MQQLPSETTARLDNYPFIQFTTRRLIQSYLREITWPDLAQIAQIIYVTQHVICFPLAIFQHVDKSLCNVSKFRVFACGKCAGALLSVGLYFWRDHILGRRMPPVEAVVSHVHALATLEASAISHIDTSPQTAIYIHVRLSYIYTDSHVGWRTV